jgi:protein-tyrosine kinase
MSRILDALKRAEEQKTTTVSVEKPVDSVAAEAVHGDQAALSAPEILSPLGLSPISQCLRLEDLRQRCTRPGWKRDPDNDVFADVSFAPCAEQFRALRSRLYQLRGMKPIRILLVTSTMSGEGKTFVALNLAHTIVCQPERRALLIDADMRAAKLHILMGAPLALGLSDYLRGEVDESSIIQADSHDNLFFIPAGSPASNPAELLANGRLKSLLDRLAPLFDWVIFDAPPILPVTDASVLGELCDGVIMVVDAGSTASDLAQTACQEFKGKNLLGVVLNRAEEAKKYGHYAYYGVKRNEQQVMAARPVSPSRAASHRALR